MNWLLVNKDDEYHDFEIYLPDGEKHGGRLRLTIYHQTGHNVAAELFVLGDTVDDGEDVFEESFSVPLEWALDVTKKWEVG